MKTSGLSYELGSSKIRIGFFQAVFELLAIVLARFPPVQRIWGAWLIPVNGASLLFITHIEAQVAIAAVGVAVIAQALIYHGSASFGCSE